MANHKIKPLSVNQILGVWLIFGVLYKLSGLLDYKYYQFMFQDLPENTIAARYCLSIALRLVGLVTGIGLILNLDFYRRTAIWLAVINLLTLYWKHPYEVFYHIAVYAEKGFPQAYPVVGPFEILAHPYFPWISLMFYSTIDIIFSSLLISFLTRPDVIAKFTPQK